MSTSLSETYQTSTESKAVPMLLIDELPPSIEAGESKPLQNWKIAFDSIMRPLGRDSYFLTCNTVQYVYHCQAYAIKPDHTILAGMPFYHAAVLFLDATPTESRLMYALLIRENEILDYLLYHFDPVGLAANQPTRKWIWDKLIKQETIDLEYPYQSKQDSYPGLPLGDFQYVMMIDGGRLAVDFALAVPRPDTETIEIFCGTDVAD